MYLEPVLNSYYKTYQNVITFSQCPVGPIKDMVTTMSPPKLSSFQTPPGSSYAQTASPFFNPGYGQGSSEAMNPTTNSVGDRWSPKEFGRGINSGCVNVLMRYPTGAGGSYSAAPKCADAYMGADDIPSVLSYLMENGYKVDTSMTKMLQNSEINIGGPAETRMSGRRKMICAFTFIMA
jgi:hypothetical protein